MEVRIACLIPVLVGLVIFLKEVRKEWNLCKTEIRLLNKLQSLHSTRDALYITWSYYNETVVTHEERFRRIDRALISLDKPVDRKAFNTSIKMARPSMANEALDTVFGKESSRRPPMGTPMLPCKLDQADIWVDHTKRDKHGKALGWLYYEIPAVPVVLEISFSVKRDQRERHEAHIHIWIRFATSETCREISSRPDAHVKIPYWRTSQRINCDEAAAEIQVVLEAKRIALLALRRDYITIDGNSPTSEYVRASGDRNLLEASLARLNREITSVESKLDSLR